MLIKNNGAYFAVLLSLFLMLNCSTGTDVMDDIDMESVVYLKNNIHAQQGLKDAKASYANWTNPGAGHVIIPVNTPITIGKFKRGFEIHNQDNGMVIYFEYHPTNMGMSLSEYLQLITSQTPVSLDGFSQTDLKGIKEGKAYIGMTKEGIRIALGYPARHRTFSLDKNTWIYWQNRFTTLAVEFDDSGKVIQIQ